MKRSFLIPALALLAGCAAGPRVDTSYTSLNQDSRVRFIVIHFTNESFESSLKTLVEPSGRPVSSHYLVRDDPPTVYRLVDENRRAWHAGVSSWRRNSALNSASIGIEIVNAGEKSSPTGTSPGDLVFAEYPKAQIDAVVELVKDIAKRHNVAPENIVGHSDIAPQRKVDPGPKFPWKRLADEGLIAWPDAAKVAERRAVFERDLPDVAWFQEHLYRHGFEVPRDGALDSETQRVISAFQMKYRPERYDGMPDAETAAILDVLLNPTAKPVTQTQELAPALDRELASIAQDAQCPLAGLSVVAIRGGEVIYERAFGRRYIDVAGSGLDKPAEPATLFRIASISKLVTTLGVMKLVEQGRLSLDEDIGTYLGYRVRNPAFPEVPITLRMLLTHTSSLRDDAGYFWLDGELKDVLVAGGSRFGTGAMWSPAHRPGTYFSYANLPWGVAGTVMERVTGKRFDRLMRELVIDPLGLQGGYNAAELAPASLANLATLYRKATAGDENVWNPQGPWVAQTDDYSVRPPVSRARDDYAIGSNGTLFGPQGGLRASTRDLARIMRMLMNGGEIDARRVLERATVERMLSRQWTREASNGQTDYGSHRGRFNAWGLGNQQFLDLSGPDYGDRLVEGGSFTAAGHLGDAYGLMGTLAFDRASGNGFAFLIGGSGCDPETQRGAYSAGARFEERIATALHRRAILGRTD